MKIPAVVKTPKFVATVCFVLAFAAFLVVVALQSDCHEKRVDSTVRTQQTEAARQANIAAQSSTNANLSNEARQTEDRLREKVIAPKLEQARRRSADSKRELEKARKNLNDAKNNLHNLNVTRADNCLKLRELFPNERFDYCADNQR